MTIRDYILGLKEGERVYETDKSSCMRGLMGTVYMSKAGGDPCVRWDSRKGGPGPMGTSATGGTRRLEDIGLELENE